MFMMKFFITSRLGLAYISPLKKIVSFYSLILFNIFLIVAYRLYISLYYNKSNQINKVYKMFIYKHIKFDNKNK